MVWLKSVLIVICIVVFAECQDPLDPIQTIKSSRTIGLGGAIVVRTAFNNAYASAYNQNTLTVFDINHDGTLEFSQLITNHTVPSIDTPFDITVTPDGRFLYLVSHSANHSGVTFFSRDLETGKLTFIGNHSNGENNTLLRAIYIVCDNNYVYVTAEKVPYITSFKILTNGSLELVETHKISDTNCEGIALYGSYLYVSSAHYLYVFLPTGGRLIQQQYIADPTISLPYSIKVSSDGNYLYVPGRLSNNFSIFKRLPNGLLYLPVVAQFNSSVGREFDEPIETFETDFYIYVVSYQYGNIGVVSKGDKMEQFEWYGIIQGNGNGAFSGATTTIKDRTFAYVAAYLASNGMLYAYQEMK